MLVVWLDINVTLRYEAAVKLRGETKLKGLWIKHDSRYIQTLHSWNALLKSAWNIEWGLVISMHVVWSVQVEKNEQQKMVAS